MMSQVFSFFAEGAAQAAFALAGGLLVIAALATNFHLHMLYRRSEHARQNQRDLIENLYEGVYRSTLDGRQLSANKALVRLNGYNCEDELLAAIGDIATEWYVVPTRRKEFRDVLLRDGFVENFVSEVYRHKTRERIWISESARLVRDRKTGRPLFYEGSVREITDTITRLDAEERLRKLSSQVPGGLIQFVRGGDGIYAMRFASSGFRALYGMDEKEPLPSAAKFVTMVHPLDRQAFLANARAGVENGEAWNQEYRIILRDGATKWLQINAKAEPLEDGVIWHGYVSDITLRKQTETEIEKLAFFDPLTGLPNRRMFIDRMTRAVAGCREKRHSGALLFIDLDNFKTLNDTRGHDVGDAYLVQVAQRLRDCVGRHDTVARIGGDEFVVILQDAGSDAATATRTAILAGNRMLSALREDYPLGGFSHRSSASIGIVVFDSENVSADEIFKRADIAMYQVKAAGRNGLALYDHGVMNAQAERYRLLDDLKVALADEALELHFQPQMDSNGRVAGAEALCRWPHPQLGMLLPRQFVPLTEQFGLSRQFTDLVLAKGLAELARWRDNQATAGLRLSLNVNAQAFVCTDFAPRLAALIDAHGVNPRLLTLEITESVTVRDRKAIARRILALKKLGVRLSLDDFGAGYSSLAYIKRMPFDELKIDGGFIDDIEHSESDRQLVKSILGTARTLKLAAVAGHVTTSGQEALLRAFGCDYFQGGFYSPALPADDFIAFAESHRDRRRPDRRSA